MYQELPPTGSVSAPTPALSWTEAWTQALTRPSVPTYENIANSASVNSNTAYLWIFVAATITSVIGIIARTIFYSNVTFAGTPLVPGGGSLLFSIICAPVAGVVAVLVTAIFTAITQAVAGALGGTGSYARLLYTSAAFAAPLSMISAVLGQIPIVGLLTYLLSLYGIVLQVTAVKAVNQFGWGKAIVAGFAIWFVVFAVLAICVLALLGPAISNVYTNIMQGVQ